MKRLILTAAAVALLASPAVAGGRRCAPSCAPASCVSYWVSYVEKEVVTYQYQQKWKDVEVTYYEASYKKNEGTYEVMKQTWVKDTQKMTVYTPVHRKVEGLVTRCSYVPTTVCNPCGCGSYTVC